MSTSKWRDIMCVGEADSTCQARGFSDSVEARVFKPDPSLQNDDPQWTIDVSCQFWAGGPDNSRKVARRRANQLGKAMAREVEKLKLRWDLEDKIKDGNL